VDPSVQNDSPLLGKKRLLTPFEHNCGELCNIYKNEGVI